MQARAAGIARNSPNRHKQPRPNYATEGGRGAEFAFLIDKVSKLTTGGTTSICFELQNSKNTTKHIENQTFSYYTRRNAIEISNFRQEQSCFLTCTIMLKSIVLGAVEIDRKSGNIICNILRQYKRKPMSIDAFQTSNWRICNYIADRNRKLDFSISGQLRPEQYWVDLLLFDGAQHVDFYRSESHIWRLGTDTKSQNKQIQIGLI